ncbi:MAG: PGPGW domain-containing protein [Xanthomonadales bacterium]|nr:PGPGW domain-containing protein [Xanthomonadales bacterium]
MNTSPGFAKARVSWPKRMLLTLLGGGLLLIGILMIFLPGPAFVFVPAGLALLALEYEFARRWLHRARRWLSAHARDRRLRNKS